MLQSGSVHGVLSECALVNLETDQHTFQTGVSNGRPNRKTMCSGEEPCQGNSSFFLHAVHGQLTHTNDKLLTTWTTSLRSRTGVRAVFTSRALLAQRCAMNVNAATGASDSSFAHLCRRSRNDNSSGVLRLESTSSS